MTSSFSSRSSRAFGRHLSLLNRTLRRGRIKTNLLRTSCTLILKDDARLLYPRKAYRCLSVSKSEIWRTRRLSSRLRQRGLPRVRCDRLNQVMRFAPSRMHARRLRMRARNRLAWPPDVDGGQTTSFLFFFVYRTIGPFWGPSYYSTCVPCIPPLIDVVLELELEEGALYSYVRSRSSACIS